MNEVLKLACQAIADKKGFNIITLDVRGLCSISDYFIIAEGSVNRHVIALAKHLDDVLGKQHIEPIHAEGLREGDWVVLDYMDFMVHLFVPELRNYYALEEVWKEGKVMDVLVEYEKKTTPPKAKAKISTKSKKRSSVSK